MPEMTIDLLDKSIKKIVNNWGEIDNRKNIMIVSDYLGYLLRRNRSGDEFNGCRFIPIGEYNIKIEFSSLEQNKMKEFIERDGFIFIKIKHEVLWELTEF